MTPMAGPDLTVCSIHPHADAIAVCTECQSDICAGCHGMDLRGFALCTPCRSQHPHALPMFTAWEAPQSQWRLAAFLQSLGEVLTNPRTFFLRYRAHARPSHAVVFGVVSVAFGSACASLWDLANKGPLSKSLAEQAAKAGVDAQTAALSLVLAVPVMAVVTFAMHVALLHITLRLFQAPTTAALSARIVGYACAAYAFLVLPPLGSFPLGNFLMYVWLFNLQVSGVRAYFQMDFWRTMAVVTIPFMLWLSMGLR